MPFWYILWSVWNIFSHFGLLYQEKSGNPARLDENFCLSVLLVKLIVGLKRFDKNRQIKKL
jgi:hypothetical protein